MHFAFELSIQRHTHFRQSTNTLWCKVQVDKHTNTASMDGRTVGVLGGGQLGRMMAEAGHRLGVKVAVLDPLGTASPAGQVAELAVEGSFRDADKIK